MKFLSILICSLESRSELLSKLREALQLQGYSKHVEILEHVDNKQKSTGVKRQELLQRAKGKYIIFIDDDDDVPNYYIRELFIASLSDADCFAINGKMTTDGKQEIAWRISKDYQNVTITEGGKQLYLRKTNHITAVKREIALQVGFPNKSNAEDKWYSDRVAPLCKSEFTITKPMYHYRFSTKNKEYK